MACPLTYQPQDYAPSIDAVANSPVSEHTTLALNPNFHFAVNDIPVMDPFGPFPSYLTEGTTPAMLGPPVAQQRPFSERTDDWNFGYILCSPPIQSVSQ